MLNKKKISAFILTALCINQVYAVNENLPQNGAPMIGATSTSVAKEEKLNVLNAGKAKVDSAYDIEMRELNNQYQKMILQHKIKQAELAMKKTEQDIKDVDNPVKKDSLTVPTPSNLPAGLNIPALSMPKFDLGVNTQASSIKQTTVETTPVKKYKKKSVKKTESEEKPILKEVAYNELPVVKGYGGFASSMQATLVYSNGSENQVQVGDVIMPNVTVSAINEKGVFVKNVNSEMKLTMWSKMINNKSKEEIKPAEPLMQAPASGPIIYPGITPSISGELKPLIQGNGEIIIPKTVGSYK